MHFFRPRKRDDLIGFMRQSGWHVRTLYDAVKVTKDMKQIVLDATSGNWKANAAIFMKKGLEVFLLVDEEISFEELEDVGVSGILPSNEQFCSRFLELIQSEKEAADQTSEIDIPFISDIPLSQRIKKENIEQDAQQNHTRLSNVDKIVEINSGTDPSEQDSHDSEIEMIFTKNTKEVNPSTITVYGAKGGVGRTVFLLNLASMLTKYGVKVCVLDLDIYQGNVASTLQIHPERTITDLVRQIHDPIERQTCLLQSGMGFSFVAAPTSYMDTSGITVETLTEVILFLKDEMDVVLIDTSSFLDDVIRVAMEHSDQVFLMTTDEPASVKNLRKMMDHFGRMTNPQFVSVLNRVSGSGMGVNELQEYLPWPLLFTLPEDVNVNKAAMRGRCITREQPTLTYSIVLEQLVKGWLGDEPITPKNWFVQLQQLVKRQLKGGM